MPKSLSEDLLWRIIWQRYYQGRTEQVAKSLYVSLKTVQRITELFNRTGSVSPAAQLHGPPRKLTELEELTLLNCFLASPGIYLDEAQHALLDKTGTWVSKSTICREAKRMGLTRKKMRRIATQRSDIARAQFMIQVQHMSADTFV